MQFENKAAAATTTTTAVAPSDCLLYTAVRVVPGYYCCCYLNVKVLPEMCVFSRQMVSHGSGLTRQVYIVLLMQ